MPAKANKDAKWIYAIAMMLEIEVLNANKTWEFVDLSSDVVPISNKWVYKVKRHADWSIERFKARLVAQGFNQIEGLDNFETFSPLAKLSIVRTLLALASIHGWYLYRLDADYAILHGDAAWVSMPTFSGPFMGLIKLVVNGLRNLLICYCLVDS